MASSLCRSSECTCTCTCSEATIEGAMEATNSISLESKEGQLLLDETDVHQEILFDMFGFQEHFSHCGLQSAALLIAAFECGKACRAAGHSAFKHCKDIKKQYQGFAMFSFKETEEVITHKVIQTRGTTLADVHRIILNHKHKATLHFAGESSEDEFRRLALEALREDDSSSGVVVNFQRYFLGQIGKVSLHGHHSPLCAYHAGTDRFLMLDTNVGKPKLWLKTAGLFKAMEDVDSATGKSRGFVIMGGTL